MSPPALLVANSCCSLSTDSEVRGNSRKQIEDLNCCGVSTPGEYPATEVCLGRIACLISAHVRTEVLVHAHLDWTSDVLQIHKLCGEFSWSRGEFFASRLYR